jgi:predicted nucleotidyltransferase
MTINATPELIMATPELIDDITNRLVKVYQPETIYLFGSYAWGAPNEESDLDFLIIVSSTDETYFKRSLKGHKVLRGLMISRDIIVYTQEEFQQRLAIPTSLATKVKNDGKVLYAKS